MCMQQKKTPAGPHLFSLVFASLSALLCVALPGAGHRWRSLPQRWGKQTASNSLPQSSLSAWTGQCPKRDSPVCIHPLGSPCPALSQSWRGPVGHHGGMWPCLPCEATSLSVSQAAYPAPYGPARWGMTHGTSLGCSPTTMGRHRLQGAAWLHLKLKL